MLVLKSVNDKLMIKALTKINFFKTSPPIFISINFQLIRR